MLLPDLLIRLHLLICLPHDINRVPSSKKIDRRRQRTGLSEAVKFTIGFDMTFGAATDLQVVEVVVEYDEDEDGEDEGFGVDPP